MLPTVSNTTRVLCRPWSRWTSSSLSGAAELHVSRRFWSWNKNDSEKSKPESATSKSSFFPDIDAKRVSLLQDMLKSQSPEKQKELMDQAMKFQQSMSKIPGFKKMAERQTKVVQQIMQDMPSSSPTPPSSADVAHFSGPPTERSPPSPSTSSRSGSGPSLDELKSVNLGQEIEELFEELRQLRSKKNHYRDLYHTTKSALEKSKAMEAQQEGLRTQLQKLQHEVMLLNSEIVDGQDRFSKLSLKEKALRQRLKDSGKSQTTDDMVRNSPTYQNLKLELEHKGDQLQSLQRKVQRLRRHDPFLQFSLACSELERLMPPSAVEVNRWSSLRQRKEEALEKLQAQYRSAQAEAWTRACQDGHAAAKAFVAFAEYFLMALIPHSSYDAVVTVPSATDSNAASPSVVQEFFEAKGFNVEIEPSGDSGTSSLVVCGPPNGTLLGAGPYAVALAAKLCPIPSSLTGEKTLHLVNVVPFLSNVLLQNPERTTITYETARSSGPGGQAVNVAETQIHAKVAVDGEAVFTASSQESRSALQNKKSVLEKVNGSKRKQLNDGLAATRPEQSHSAAVKTLLERGGSSGVAEGALTRQDAVALVQQAVMSGALLPLEGSLVQMVLRLAQEVMQKP